MHFQDNNIFPVIMHFPQLLQVIINCSKRMKSTELVLIVNNILRTRSLKKSRSNQQQQYYSMHWP